MEIKDSSSADLESGTINGSRSPMRQKVLFISGIVLTLVGAAVMIHGSLFGERTIPAAITIGIVGIGLIARSKFSLLK